MDPTGYDDNDSRISTIGTRQTDEDKSIGDSHWKRESYMSDIRTDEEKQSRPPTPRRLEKLAPKDVPSRDQISMIIGPPVILLFDLIVPCIIYYVWLHNAGKKWVQSCQAFGRDLQTCPNKPEHNDWILGIAVVSFGFGEIYILLARVIRLIKYPNDCAPLLSKHWAELDATSWVYLASLIVPLTTFIVSTNNNGKVIPWLYLCGPGFLMGFLAILSCITLIPFKLPFRVNSTEKGSRCKPLCYWAAEDFIAVDGWQGRDFRVRFKARYEQSRMFRKFFVKLTMFWIAGASIYIGCLAAIIWNLEFEYAFGVSFGVLFSYITIWASTTFVWVGMEMSRQKRAFERGDPNF